jgi:rhodanese-related sulfurtransferase
MKSRMFALFGALAVLTTFAALPSAIAGGKECEECEECSTAKVAVRAVTLAEVRAIVSGKQKGVIIDSRDFYAYKQGHIPGAISLAVDDMKAKADRLPKAKDTLLVFYCGGGGCSLSHEAADKATAMGYKKVAVFKDGWRGWTQTASR